MPPVNPIGIIAATGRRAMPPPPPPQEVLSAQMPGGEQIAALGPEDFINYITQQAQAGDTDALELLSAFSDAPGRSIPSGGGIMRLSGGDAATLPGAASPGGMPPPSGGPSSYVPMPDPSGAGASFPGAEPLQGEPQITRGPATGMAAPAADNAEEMKRRLQDFRWRMQTARPEDFPGLYAELQASGAELGFQPESPAVEAARINQETARMTQGEIGKRAQAGIQSRESMNKDKMTLAEKAQDLKERAFQAAQDGRISKQEADLIQLSQRNLEARSQAIAKRQQNAMTGEEMRALGDELGALEGEMEELGALIDGRISGAGAAPAAKPAEVAAPGGGDDNTRASEIKDALAARLGRKPTREELVAELEKNGISVKK